MLAASPFLNSLSTLQAVPFGIMIIKAVTSCFGFRAGFLVREPVQDTMCGFHLHPQNIWATTGIIPSSSANIPIAIIALPDVPYMIKDIPQDETTAPVIIISFGFIFPASSHPASFLHPP